MFGQHMSVSSIIFKRRSVLDTCPRRVEKKKTSLLRLGFFPMSLLIFLPGKFSFGSAAPRVHGQNPSITDWGHVEEIPETVGRELFLPTIDEYVFSSIGNYALKNVPAGRTNKVGTRRRCEASKGARVDRLDHLDLGVGNFFFFYARRVEGGRNGEMVAHRQRRESLSSFLFSGSTSSTARCRDTFCDPQEANR